MKVLFFLIFSILLIGCTTSEYILNDKIPLVGDYTQAETIDYFDEGERPTYILTSKMACAEKDAKCVLIMEIDYQRFTKDMMDMFSTCGIDSENINTNITEEQKNCARELMTSLGMKVS